MENMAKVNDPRTGKPTDSVRYNGKCKKCGTKKSFLAIGRYETERENSYGGNYSTMYQNKEGQELEFDNGSLLSPHSCPSSNHNYIRLGPVFGTYSEEKECNGRCMAATGHQCECQCGGKNHGANHG